VIVRQQRPEAVRDANGKPADPITVENGASAVVNHVKIMAMDGVHAMHLAPGRQPGRERGETASAQTTASSSCFRPTAGAFARGAATIS
jgi:hypothetical protein